MPTVLKPLKILLITVCLVLSLAYLANNRSVKISTFAFWISLFYVLTGLAWAVYGQLKGNPGAIPTMTVMVAYPLLLPLLAFSYKEEDAPGLHSLFLNSAILLAVFDIFFIMTSIVSPDNPLALLMRELHQDTVVIDNAETYFKFTMPNIASAIFLLPYAVISAFSGMPRKRLAIMASILLSVVLILSGRRAGFIAPLLAIISLPVIFARKPKIPTAKSLIKILLYCLVFLLIAVIGFSIYYGSEYYFKSIESILNFSSNASNLERAAQFYALVEGIDASPLFGHGAGAAASYTRSETQAWAYELSYLAFIFQYGLCGFVIYAAGICMLSYTLIFAIHRKGLRSFEFCYLAGFISFMIANATNPYLAKFDYMWVIFIPVAILNRQMAPKQ